MQVAVRPRVVAAPWERPTAGPGIRVGAESDVEPEPGPTELYRSRWPHRYVRWNRARQLFEIRQRNPHTGFDERYEFVFYYDAPPDPELERPWTEEELAEMIGRNDARLVKVFRPFDYRYVRERIRQSHEFLHLGAERATDRRMDRNRRRHQRRVRHVASEGAAAIGEARRWLPALAAAYEAKRRGDPRPLSVLVEENKEKRTPLVTGGLTR